jgi:hypothetical protein
MDRMTAERQELQTVGVLRRLDGLFTEGRWVRGRHYGDGGYCLNGAIVSSTRWTVPGVDKRARAELCRSLPVLGRITSKLIGKRATLALYNDWVGRDRGVRRLVKATLARVDEGQPFDIREILGAEQSEAAGRAPEVWTARQRRAQVQHTA